MEHTENWTETDREFIISTLKKYFELDRNRAQMLIDYAKAHPTEYIHNGDRLISYNIQIGWLRPNKLGHCLCIDADQGLKSQWLGYEKNGSDRAFDKAMRASKNKSLINLEIFLQKVKDDQNYARSEFNDRRGLQLWDQKYTAKYGSLAQIS